MRKWLFFLLCFAGAILSAACEGREAIESNGEGEVVIQVTPDRGPFEQPPPLLVNGETEALLSTHCWGTAALAEEMGEMVMFCADSLHPLDIPELSPAVGYPLKREGVLTLSWPAEPDTVSASYWRLEELEPDTYASEQTAEQIPLPYENGQITVAPEDLPCMVMVSADWQPGTLTDCYGDASYSFRVVPAE